MVLIADMRLPDGIGMERCCCSCADQSRSERCIVGDDGLPPAPPETLSRVCARARSTI